MESDVSRSFNQLTTVKVTYESKGNFKDLADEASERLNNTKLTKPDQADPSPD